jgi:hypothetical protein
MFVCDFHIYLVEQCPRRRQAAGVLHVFVCDCDIYLRGEVNFQGF